MYAHIDRGLDSSGSRHSSQALARPALIGRADILSELAQALAVPGYRGAAISGGPGAGKSRLLTEAAATAEELGYRLIRVQCTPSNTLISLQAVGAAFQTAGLAAPGDVDDAVASLLGSGHRSRTKTLLCVDDAHLADAATAELMLRAVRDKACSVLMTVSDTRLACAEIYALWKNESIPRLVLPELSRDDVEQVCLGFLPGLVGLGIAERYAMLCGGDLLLLQELLADAIETGALKEVDGVWSDAEATYASDRLVPLVASKLRDLDADHQAAFEALSLAGSVPLSVAKQIASTEAWEALEGRRLICVTSDDDEIELTIKDEVVSRFLLRRLPVLRRRRLLATLVAAFDTDNAWSGSTRVQRALWHQELGMPLSASELEAAATSAWWAQDWGTAGQLALHARGMAPSPSADALLARIRLHQGQTSRALYDCGTKRSERLVEKQTHIALSNSKRRSGHWSAVADDEQRQELPASPAQGGNTEQSPAAAIDRGARLLDAGQIRLAWETVEPFLRIADPSLALGAATVAIPSLLRMGRPQDCAEMAPMWEAAIDKIRSQDVPNHDPFSITTQLAYARGMAGNADEAISQLRAQLRRAAARNNSYLCGQAAVHLARLLFVRGQVHQAHRLYAAVNEAGVSRPTYQLAVAGAVICAVHLEDRKAVERAAARLAATRHDPGRLAEIDIASAVLEAHEGRKTCAVQALQETAEQLLEAGALGQLSEVIHFLTRLDRVKLANQYCAGTLEDLQGALSRTSVALARATAARKPEAVGQCAQHFESAGAPLYAAEAWAIAVHLYRRAGQPRLATAAARRCETARANYDGTSPPLLHLIGETELLSGREREIALLAAQRHTSQEIAERLVISVRTVDNHLYRIYRKLGVSSRQQLRIVLSSQ
jgi:DNA-binding CsgD family transcriptional regulator